jgi:hypothetical protein
MENAFDRRLSEKIRAELSAHHEPFQPQDWSKMKNRLDAYKRTPQYWLTKASGAICLFVMLFSIVHQTSNKDYRLIQKAIFSINAKAASWWSKQDEASKHIESEAHIFATENNNVSNQDIRIQLQEDLFFKNISSNKNYELIDFTPQKEISILDTNEIDAIALSVIPLDSSQLEETKDLLSKLDSKDFMLIESNLDSVLSEKKDWRYVKVSKLKSSLRTSIVGALIHNYNKDLGLKYQTIGMGVLVGSSILKDKFIVQTGAIYGRFVNEELYTKIVKEGKKEITENVPLRGNFYLVDIPIRMQYNFKSYNSKYQAFVSTTLSNYFFVEEDVKKTTLPKGINKRYSQNAYYPSKNTQFGENMDWASSLTLSVGVERKINSSTSISLEPYLLIPIQGIGTESIRLQATGLMMKINFQSKNQKLK